MTPAMNSISVATIRDVLSCPITYQVMTNPVSDTCGHTFEADAIARCLLDKQECPLSKNPLTTRNLLPNRTLKDLIDIVKEQDPSILQESYKADQHSFLENLADEDRERVVVAVREIFNRRTTDESRGIPTRLPTPLVLIQRAVRAVGNAYSSTYSC